MGNCTVCMDTRHIQNPATGCWEPCECLLRQRRDECCKMARIPAEYWPLSIEKNFLADSPPLKQLKTGLVSLLAAFRQGKLPTQPMVIMGRAPYHKQVGWMLLKAALVNYRGFSAGLDELVTSFLTPDKREFSAMQECRVLMVSLGDEYTQPIHKWMVEHLMQIRAEQRFTTLWTAPFYPNGLTARYGPFPVFEASGNHITVPEGFELTPG